MHFTVEKKTQLKNVKNKKNANNQYKKILYKKMIFIIKKVKV
jgi:hypothetical protein